jgi:16S rRNA U516 pseudouridylate synthase RsuA-like enzyme
MASVLSATSLLRSACGSASPLLPATARACAWGGVKIQYRHGGTKHKRWIRSRHTIQHDMEVRERTLRAIMADRGAGTWPQALKTLYSGVVKINNRVGFIRASVKKKTDTLIVVNDKVLEPVPILALYNKPLGEDFDPDDPWDGVRDAFKKPLPQKFPYLSKMHTVGRLNANATGLLLFSRSYNATNAILAESNLLEHEYDAVVAGNVQEDELREKLTTGIETDEGVLCADLVSVRRITDSEVGRGVM